MSVYEKMRQALITGKYKPGDRLTEEALTEEFQVSRTPIRSALKQLEFDGLITPLRRGYVARSFSRKDIRQIYDVRSLLEGYAASLSAIHRTDEDLDNMYAANAAFYSTITEQEDNKIEHIQAILQKNHQFHQAVIRASQDPHTEDLIRKVVVLPLVFHSFFWFQQRELEQSFHLHEVIIAAIKDQDSARARSAMHEHIYQGRDRVLEQLEREKG
ncbi:transcriptional regulator, GntR family [Geomicrobium sp. JCM 19037]|uniref:GntR family transcriptional regulator n=1 Tax=unclassified Geomicrobium TaxID=2628951 RepID=UPI00045F3C3D|nr:MULTISPECIES: GntR family transcriptional regulator [unclassified Geomicrobium]GAK03655.1 transcriptional regulator, GntR family [Geomicrobium sp. JCM 19037]GAK12630.1 transcriptional regulator, GntR family [Geomicrobium sp. JCM 19039]